MTYGHKEDSEFSSPSFKRSTVQSQMQHSASTGEFLESFSIDPTDISDFKYWPADLCTRVDVSDEAGKVDYQIHLQVLDAPTPSILLLPCICSEYHASFLLFVVCVLSTCDRAKIVKNYSDPPEI